MRMSTLTISGRNSRRTRRADVARAALDDATFSSARYPADSGLSAIIIPPTPSRQPGNGRRRGRPRMAVRADPGDHHPQARRTRRRRIDTAAARPYPAIGINSGWSSLPATFAPYPAIGDGGLPAGAFGL